MLISYSYNRKHKIQQIHSRNPITRRSFGLPWYLIPDISIYYVSWNLYFSYIYQASTYVHFSPLLKMGDYKRRPLQKNVYILRNDLCGIPQKRLQIIPYAQYQVPLKYPSTPSLGLVLWLAEARGEIVFVTEARIWKIGMSLLLLKSMTSYRMLEIAYYRMRGMWLCNPLPHTNSFHMLCKWMKPS